MKQVVCFYQLCQHKVGNCKICIADEKNKLCENYTPITLFTFTAVDRESEVRQNETLSP